MKFGFLIDHRKCIGCHACSVACKEEHQVPLGVYRNYRPRDTAAARGVDTGHLWGGHAVQSRNQGAVTRYVALGLTKPWALARACHATSVAVDETLFWLEPWFFLPVMVYIFHALSHNKN